jgi:hypothetical protein
MPDLVGVASPDTEDELAAIVEMLEAHDVPCFYDVCVGGVSSEVHGCVRKPRTIMVPRTRVTEAARLIEDLKSSRAAHDDVGRFQLSSRLRALVRFVWFGWYRPARNFR